MNLLAAVRALAALRRRRRAQQMLTPCTKHVVPGSSPGAAPNAPGTGREAISGHCEPGRAPLLYLPPRNAAADPARKRRRHVSRVHGVDVRVAAISGLMAMVMLVLLVLVDRLVRVDRQLR
jgi:hypothetical protein